jgi:fluoride exporter
MYTYLAVAVAGVLGCWLRLFMGTWIPVWTGRDFPYATLTINVLGSFLMGFLFIATAERFAISPALRVGILTGFLGGFTTFSAFSMELLLLIQGGEPGRGAIYVVSSVVLGLAACFAGAVLARGI